MYSKRDDFNGDFSFPASSAGPDAPSASGLTVAQNEAWIRIKARLRAELGEDIYNSWFARMEFVGGEHGVALLTVPTKFLRSWIVSHYRDRLVKLVTEAEIGFTDVAVMTRIAGQSAGARVVRPASDSRLPAPHTESAASSSAVVPVPAHEQDGLVGSPLDRRLTFDNFIVGTSNAFAHAAAQQVARIKLGEKPLYNPLFVHSAVGLGKTHLCQALAHALEAGGRRIVYLTAERFMYGFVAALKAQTAIAFKEKLRAIDVLIIDDAQFLTGKAIQQEFCHTLNALIDAGKQVIVAADRAPIDLETIEDRMRSRLQAGLVVEIGTLDDDLRVGILETRIAAARTHLPTFEVRPEVVVWLARNLTANGRDLEGAVNRLLAHATLTGTALDIDAAESAIRDLIRIREPKKVRIEDIQRLVANHFNVSKADILSSRRTATVVRPRQIAMYLSKSLTPRSLPEIGRRFGGRDHTTVLHAVRKIEELASNDAGLAGDIDLLKRMLLE